MSRRVSETISKTGLSAIDCSKSSFRPATILVAAAALSVGLSAVAQDEASLSTMQQAAGPISFESFDQNGDGVVTEEEFNQIQSERMAERAEQAAAMGNAVNRATFSDFDLDGDGQLTAVELEHAQQARQRQAGMRQGSGIGQGRGQRQGIGRGMSMPDFSEFDADGDGTLSEAEFYQGRAERMSERAQQGGRMRNAASAPSFEAVDSDGDGLLSPEEFRAAQAQHHQQR